jgi:hypothetical protein
MLIGPSQQRFGGAKLRNNKASEAGEAKGASKMQTLKITFGDLVIETTSDSVAVAQPKAEAAATTAAPSTKSTSTKPSASKKRRSTKSTRKSSTKSTKKAKLSVAEIREMVDNGQFYQAISACRDQGWDPSKTDGRLRPKADKPTKSASKSTKSTKKAASKKPSAPKPKASAKAERPVDQEPEAPVKEQKLSASQELHRQRRAKLGDYIATYGGDDVDEILLDFIAKPTKKHVVIEDHGMLTDTWIELTKLEETEGLGQADDEVVRMIIDANKFVGLLAEKAGLV